ncbi:Bromodomain and WD repeat-containing protein 1 [Intoshia linei]|uniref:Bromodomain and WD repeat-containing protein 1 n=1 Tax=Intoshia linei TaxID=1819745 RepID=A0A177B337_9BILA|nr:Bromodomain and WD repeat-containing protein 1 [Intoshia linei]
MSSDSSSSADTPTVEIQKLSDREIKSSDETEKIKNEFQNTADKSIKEMYFLIYKFLSDGPCKNTLKIFENELAQNNLLPSGLTFEGHCYQKHIKTLVQLYNHIPSSHLMDIIMQFKNLVNNYRKKKKINSILENLKYTLYDPPNDGFLINGYNAISRINLTPIIYPKCSYQDRPNLFQILRGREVSGSLNFTNTKLPPSIYKNLTFQTRILGHLAAIYCIIFDKTNTRIISGADDCIVKIWCLKTACLLFSLRGHREPISDLTIDSKNTLLASGSCDKLIRIWLLQTGETLAVLSGHSAIITIVRFSPHNGGNKCYLSSTGFDASICFWAYNSTTNIFDSKPIKYVERSRAGVHILCQSYSSGGLFLVSGSSDSVIRIYSFTDEFVTKECELLEHCDKVDSVEFAHNIMEFVSGSQDGTSILWKYRCGKWVPQSIPIPTSSNDMKPKVTMIAWNSDDRFIITATNDRKICVFNAGTVAFVNQLQSHTDEIFVLNSHPKDPRILLSAGHDGQINVWDILDQNSKQLMYYENFISGQGNGAIFDAQWSVYGEKIGAVDSHGHLVILGFGKCTEYSNRPAEQFFHTDYRPLLRDNSDFVLDQQTLQHPHLMPPPFLVNMDGQPHSVSVQRFVPGREFMSDEQLRPVLVQGVSGFREIAPYVATEDSVTFLQRPPVSPIDTSELNFAELVTNMPDESAIRQLRRYGETEGVRMTRGRVPVSQISSEKQLSSTKQRVIVRPLSEFYVMVNIKKIRAKRNAEINLYKTEQANFEEENEYTVDIGERRLRTRVINNNYNEDTAVSDNQSNESDWSESLQTMRRRTRHGNRHLSHEETEQEESRTVQTVTTRRRTRRNRWSRNGDLRRSIPRRRLSPIDDEAEARDERSMRREQRALQNIIEHELSDDTDEDSESIENLSRISYAHHNQALENYVCPEWINEVHQKRNPYIPQLGDVLVYFQDGHKKYVEEVEAKNIYEMTNEFKPWTQNIPIENKEYIRVIDIKYEIAPPLVITCKMAMIDPYTKEFKGTTFSLKYHDVLGVIEFIILLDIYNVSIHKRWRNGEKFRCLIVGVWYHGEFLHSTDDEFQSIKVKWDSGEIDRLNPWDIEQIVPERVPDSNASEYGATLEEHMLSYGAVKFKSVIDAGGESYKNSLVRMIDSVITMPIAQDFVNPVDISIYPLYAINVPYMMDLTKIRERILNGYYRQLVSLINDISLIYSNALLFNQSDSEIVQSSEVITHLLKDKIQNINNRHLESDNLNNPSFYLSIGDFEQDESDKESTSKNSDPNDDSPKWLCSCLTLTYRIFDCADAEPFRNNVDLDVYPNYTSIVNNTICIKTVLDNLELGKYNNPQQYAIDMRLIFKNSRTFNTNKRSKIYAMTLRLSAMFEEKITDIIDTYTKTFKDTRRLRSDTAFMEESIMSNNSSHYSDSDSPAVSNVYKRKLRSSFSSKTLTEKNLDHSNYKLRKRTRVNYNSNL